MSSKPWNVYFFALAFAFALCAFCPIGFAQTAPVEKTDADTKTTDRDSDEHALIDASGVPGNSPPRSVEVVPSFEIRASQARSVPEALQETLGVYVQETSPAAGTPAVRGLFGSQNLIVFDGVRLTTGTFRTGAGRYLAGFDPLALERIEVIRGPGAVLYGNGAMGGVFRLVPKQPDIVEGKNGAAGSLTGRLASADMSPGGALSLAAKAQGLTLSGGGSVTRFGELRSGGGDAQPQSAYTVGTWRAKAVRQLGKSMSLTTAYLGSSVDNSARVDGLGRGSLRFYDGDDHLAYAALAYESKGTVRRVRLLGSYQRLDEVMERFSCAQDADGTAADLAACVALDESTVLMRSRFRDVVNTAGAKLDFDVSFLENRLDIQGGFEVYHDWIGSSRQDALASEGFAWRAAPRGILSDGSTHRTLGVFLYGDLLVWDIGARVGQLHVAGGGRFFDFAAHAPDVPTIGNVSYGDNGFLGEAGLQLIRPNFYNLYASFSQGLRSPTLQETTVLGNTGSAFEVPNEDLRLERIDTVEVGAKLSLGPMSFRGAWFYSFLRDAIDEDDATWQGQTQISGLPVVRRVNADSGHLAGLEGGAGLSFWRLTLGAGVTWTKGELTAGGETHPARRVPPIFGKGSVLYEHGDSGLWIEAFTLWAGRQDSLHPRDKEDLGICETGDFSGVLREDCKGTAPWFTLNLRGGVRFLKRFRADVGLYNLADANYRRHGSGFDMPGFDARALLTYEM